MRARVLIVDDNRSRRGLTAELLRFARHEALQAGSEAQALALVQGERPHVLLLEASLPGAGWRSLCARIKRECGYHPPPALILVSPRGAELDGLDPHVDDYIGHPLEQGELLARVATMLRLRAQQSALAEQSAQAHALSALSQAALRPEDNRLTRVAVEAAVSAIGASGCAVLRGGSPSLEALAACPGPCRGDTGLEPYLARVAELALALGRRLASGQGDGSPLDALAAQRPESVRATLALPLADAEGTLGCLVIWSCESISDERADFAESFARTLTLALRRQATQEQLAASEANYRQLVENTHDGIWRIDGEGHIRFANQRLMAMLGYAPEEVPGRHFTEFVPPDLLTEARERFSRRRGGEAGRYETRLCHKNGTELNVTQSVMPLFGADGAFLGAIGVTTDITEQRRHGEVQAHERRLLRLIAADAPLATVLGELCRSLEELSPRALRAAVVRADRSAGRFRLIAAPSLPDSFATALATMPLDDPSLPCARAIATRQPIVIGDVGQEPAECPIVGAAQTLGFGAAWSFPVLLQGQAVATLALFPSLPSTPEEGEYQLIEFAVELARIAFDHAEYERALRESTERLELMARAAHVGLWDAELATGRSYYSPEWKRQLGYEEHEISDRHEEWVERLHPEDRSRILGQAARLMESGQGEFEEEFRLRHKDGGYRWILSRGALVRDADGKPVRLAGCHIDVTERKAMMDALHRSEEEYRRLVQGNPLPIWLFDRETLQLLEASAGVCALVGRSREDILSRQVTEFRPPQERERFAARVRRSRTDGAFEEAGLWPTLRADGTTILTRISWGNVCYGGRAAKIAFLKDVTRQVRAEERVRELNATLEERVRARTAELEAANRELDAFNYSVSHDLRTPLRAIEGFSRALLEDYAARLDAEGCHYLERIGASAQRMAGLIDAMHNLSRLSRSVMRIAPVDLSAMARSVIDELRQGEPGRHVEVSIAPAITAEADAGLMHIVLANLLGNAWKYTARVAHARIEFGALEGEDGRPVYCVRDNGAGFDMQFADKLFKLFHRLHREEDFPGHGVGLATVQRVLRRHGGRVWAQARKGCGATFCFTLWENEAMRSAHEEALALEHGG